MTSDTDHPTPDVYSAIQREPDGTLYLPLDLTQRLTVDPDTGRISFQLLLLGVTWETVTEVDPRNLQVLITRSERAGGRGHRNLPHGVAGYPSRDAK